MADNIEHQDKGEPVTNCDRLQNDEVVVTTPVESRIMSIREKQIMIDRDLAELYGVETKRLNEAVKRNIERFPERFRFQLTKEEMAELVANCDWFFFIYVVCHISIFIFEITNCDLKRVVTYYCIQR